MGVEHVLELLELAHHLLEALVVEHQQPDARTRAVGHRHAQDALDVERATREEIADVAHHPGVVVHIQFQNDLGVAGLRQRVGNLFDHHQPPIISVLAAPGGTMG
jgi:tRNA G18 (ribose-2'-O)-methylase SpoU